MRYGLMIWFMPYTQDTVGIYRIVDTVAGKCYVGQSLRVRKRVAEHFRLLRTGKHPNPHLQRAYIKRPEAFISELEVECAPEDLDQIENAFLCGEAQFDEPTAFNIAAVAAVPMRGKTHTAAAREKITSSVRARAAAGEFQKPAYRQALRDAKQRYFFADAAFVARLRYILDNAHLSYAERGRAVGRETTTVRRLFLKYQHLKGVL